MKTPEKSSYKSVDALVKHTTSKTFQRYWTEMKRHRKQLHRIYQGDKRHKCSIIEHGAVSRVIPSRLKIISFFECELCGQEYTRNEKTGKFSKLKS